MTVLQFLNDWLTLRAAALKPRTVDMYAGLISRYVAHPWGDLPVDQLTAAHIRTVLAAICAAGHTRTAEQLFVMLKCALADLDPCPMRGVPRPAHVQTSPVAWSDVQISAYLAALPSSPQCLALSLALLLGLRRGEVCGLRWKDIDFTRGVAHIRNQRVRLDSGVIVDIPPKSRTSVRSLPIPAPLMARLRASRQLSGYVCPITPSGLDSAHRRLVRRLALPYIPLHGLRHCFATACIRHGGDMRCLQLLLGHASYATTANRYTHPDAEMLRAALDSASALCYTL